MKDMRSSNPRAFFLDFDGVVVESTNIKTEAFYEVYLSYGEGIAKKAKEYHLNHQGTARAIKFQEIHKRFLDKECDGHERAKLSHVFSEIVLEKILGCPLVGGVTEFLEENLKKNIPVFLMSATPHQELLAIVHGRGLSPYFKEVHGAPRTKTEIGRNLLAKYLVRQNQVVFIGDSVSDYMASQELGTMFVGRQSGSLPVEFERVPVIQNFQELLDRSSGEDI